MLETYPAFIWVQMNIVTLFSYSIIHNNIIFIDLYSTFQNFRFHVKCSIFVSSALDMQNKNLLLIHGIVIILLDTIEVLKISEN